MADFRLDRLSAAESIVGSNGAPTQAFQRRIQKAWGKIEEAFDDLTAKQASLAAQLALIQAVTRNDAISASYTAPGTVLTASDAGTNATITIAAHTRVYGDISNISVNGGSVTALAYSTLYYVYYNDPTRVGGAVTYSATTNANTALPTAAAGRHYVGSVTTPASGGGSTSGGSAPPSGGGGITRSEINSTL